MVPRLVLMVMSRVPERGSPVAGGVPTSLRFLLGAWEADGDALGFGLGSHVQCVGEAELVGAVVAFFLPPDVATSHTTRPSTTTAATTEPITAPRLRRRVAAAARSAISRSSRARAAARWRSLVGLTVLNLPGVEVRQPRQDFADGEADGGVLGEVLGDGVAADEAEAVGPTVSVWMVISFFGWPPPGWSL